MPISFVFSRRWGRENNRRATQMQWKRATCTDRYATETKTVVLRRGNENEQSGIGDSSREKFEPDVFISSGRRKCERTERDGVVERCGRCFGLYG